MAHRIARVVGVAAGALGLVGGVVAVAASGDEPLNPAAAAVSDLPDVTDFSMDTRGDGCVFDRDRGGLVLDGVTVRSRSTGVMEPSFYVQRGDDLDDILPGYTTFVLVFDDDSREHTLDVVLPVSREDYEAGYDECRYSTPGD